MKDSKLRKLAELTKKTIPESIKVLSSEDAKFLLHELSVHQVELEAQNDELREMQNRLEEVHDMYADLFDFAPVGYFILDTNGTILNANLTGCSLLKYSRSSVINKPFSVYISNDDDGTLTFYRYLRAVFSSQTIESCELFLKRKGEQNFVALLESVVVVDNEGQKINCRMTLKDITNDKKTVELEFLNRALTREKERAQNYLNMSSVFFMALDNEGRIKMINKFACEILGYTCTNSLGECETQIKCRACSLKGTNWFDHYIPERTRKESKNKFEQRVKKNIKTIVAKESLILTRMGEERLISWNINTLLDIEGQVIGSLWSGNDITEQNIAKKKLEDSERMFRTLFDLASKSVIMTNNKGEIVRINKTTEDVFGYAEEELIGQSIEMLIPKHYRPLHIDSRSTVITKAQTRTAGIDKDLYALNKNGKEFPVEVSLSSYNNGQETLVMAFIDNIATRKAAQEKLINDKIELERRVEERTYELLKSQQLHETIARNYPNGAIMVLDENLNYVFVEGKELYKKGIIGQDLIGTSFLRRMDPEARTEIHKSLTNVLKGKNTSFESKSKGKVHLLNAVGIENDNNEIKQILVVSQNITKLKKAEEDILKSLKNEQHLNVLKSRFVSMASHEFRTPLTSVLNSTNLLSKYMDIPNSSENQKKHVKRIKLSLNNLTNILDDFLSLDQLEQGEVTVRLQQMSITDFFRDMVDSFVGVVLKSSWINYTHKGEEEVTTDKHILKNILNNLLSNAVKYSPEESEIVLKSRVENGILVIIVKDNGIGIPKAEQKNIFDRFFRAENASNIQGTGLGLNIVKNYLDLLKGEISFVSEFNKGTTFTVRIPV